jgi:hypothetical protein
MDHLNKLFHSRSSSLTRTLFKFIAIQTSNYKPVIEQCLSAIVPTHRDTPGSSSTSRLRSEERKRLKEDKTFRELASWWPLFKLHQRIVFIYYIFILLKYPLVQLLAPGSWLSDYQMLDCFLIGRFKLFGRTGKLSGQLVIFITLYFTLYRLYIICVLPKFRFYAFEFLLHDYETIRLEETRAKLAPCQHQQPKLQQQYESASGACYRLPAGEPANPLLYLTSKFDSGQKFLRLNRTSDSWDRLNTFARLLLLASLTGTLVWVCLVWYMLVGAFLTNFGFEMTYPTCVSWLKGRQQPDEQWKGGSANDQYDYSFIYVAPKLSANDLQIEQLPIRVPLKADDLQRFSIYNTIRIVADMAENYLIYLEFILTFFAHFCTLIMNSLDILQNANEIKVKLIKNIETLSELDQRSHFITWSAYNMAAPVSKQNRLNDLDDKDLLATIERKISSYRQLEHELDETQALLVDHFELTKAYNVYASTFFLFIFAGWTCYTTIVCIWMAQVRSRAVEIEFVIVEVGACFLAMVFLWSAEIVRSRNFELYPLITRLMARDCVFSATKSRWPTILMFYYPRPMYCLTLLGFCEISWLFNLKVSNQDKPIRHGAKIKTPDRTQLGLHPLTHEQSKTNLSICSSCPGS